MNELVSVIVPNYNCEKYIGECLDSIIAQTYHELEIIVVDDGSTDCSTKIVEQYMKKDNRIRLIRQANMNAAIARNRGIEWAKGEFVYFIDSDDVLYENSISIMVHMMIERSCDMVVGNYVLIDENGIIYQKDKIKNVDFREPMELCGERAVPANKLYRRDLITKNKVYFANVRIGQDSNFYLKYLLCCKKIEIVDDIIFGYRVLEGSISRSYSYKIFDIVDEFADVRKFYQKNGALDKYEHYLCVIEYVNCYYQMCKQVHFRNKAQRKVIVLFFKNHLNTINVENCFNYEAYKEICRKCRVRTTFASLYYSNLFIWLHRVLKK